MELATDELIAAPADAQIFEFELRPMLGDCGPSGRIRLDAIARWLQDVAYSDVLDSGVAHFGFWVLRRTRIVASSFPRFAERYRVSTFCSGVGRMWAQRRTTITPVLGAGGPLATGTRRTGAAAAEAGAAAVQPIVEAVALWVHLAPDSRKPSRVTEPELAVMGESARNRDVPRHLRHPRPGAASRSGEWWFRHTDCDVADHINNAAYWEPLEEDFLERERAQAEILRSIDIEVEFRTPAQPGRKLILSDGTTRWLVAPEDDAEAPGEVYSSTIVRNASTSSGSN